MDVDVLTLPVLSIHYSSVQRKKRAREIGRELFTTKSRPDDTVEPEEEKENEEDTTRKNQLEQATQQLHQTWCTKLLEAYDALTAASPSSPLTPFAFEALQCRRNRLNLLLPASARIKELIPLNSPAIPPASVVPEGTSLAETAAIQLLSDTARLILSERECGIAIPLLHPSAETFQHPATATQQQHSQSTRIGQYQLLLQRSSELIQSYDADLTKPPGSAETAALVLSLSNTMTYHGSVCECMPLPAVAAAPQQLSDPTIPEPECICARHLALPMYTAASGTGLDTLFTLGGGGDVSSYAEKASMQRSSPKANLFLACSDLPRYTGTLPAPLLTSCSIHLSPRIWFLSRASGMLSVLHTGVIEATQGMQPTRKQEWLQAFNKHAQRYPMPLDGGARQPFLSPLVLAVEKLCTALVNLRNQVTQDVTLAGSTPAGFLFLFQISKMLQQSVITLGQTLLRLLDSTCVKIASNPGRDLLQMCMEHHQAWMLTERMRKVATGSGSSGGNSGGNSIGSSSSSAIPLPPQMHLLLCSLQSATSRLMECSRLSATTWAQQVWPEMMLAQEQRAKGKQSKELVRLGMPVPLPQLPRLDGNVLDSSPWGEATSSPSPAAGTTTPGQSPQPTGSPGPSGPPRPSPSPSPSPTPAGPDSRPSPLMLFLEDYMLPILPLAAGNLHPTGSGLLLSSILDGVLESFLIHLQLEKVAVNGQGATLLNQELKWLWQWMQFRHVRARVREQNVSDAASRVKPPSILAPIDRSWPASSSPFLTSADLHDLLSQTELDWWRACFSRLSVWNRASSIVSVLLAPGAYGYNPSATSNKSASKDASSNSTTNNQTELRTWTWPGADGAIVGGGAPSGSPEPTGSPVSGASNRIAPLPPSFATSSPSHVSTNAATDHRGVALTDLSQWLSLTSAVHASKFAAASRANTVDWPERR